MQYFFALIREISLIRSRISISFFDEVEEDTFRIALGIIADLAESAILKFNGTIEQEEEKKEDIFSGSIMYREDEEPVMIMYITISFSSENDKNLYTDFFIKRMMG